MERNQFSIYYIYIYMYLHRYMHRHEDFLQDLNQVVEFRFAAVRFDESHIW